MARFLGDVGYLIGDCSKKSVWCMADTNSQILFVGPKKDASDLLQQFFDENASCEMVGQTYPFMLSRKSRQWLQAGYDLMVIEQSRLHPSRLRTPVSFAVPHWVNQTMPLPAQMDKFLSGNRYHHLRNHINKCCNIGCGWRFTQLREDFDLFYQRMYLPFVHSRHGEMAHIAPYPLQWDLWIKGAGGGLVLVTQAGREVAGVICLISGEVCYNIEIGVLDADESLIKQGIIAYIVRAAAEWGSERGAKFYNIGGSFGWRSNAAFHWKAKWGTRVAQRENPYRVFCFAADQLSPTMVEKINSIGLLSEKGKDIYEIKIVNQASRLSDDNFSEMIANAHKEGLCGVCVIAPGREPQFYGDASRKTVYIVPPAKA